MATSVPFRDNNTVRADLLKEGTRNWTTRRLSRVEKLQSHLDCRHDTKYESAKRAWHNPLTRWTALAGRGWSSSSINASGTSPSNSNRNSCQIGGCWVALRKRRETCRRTTTWLTACSYPFLMNLRFLCQGTKETMRSRPSLGMLSK